MVLRGGCAAEPDFLLWVVDPDRVRLPVLAAVAADRGRSVATGADGSASGREQRERSKARR